MTKTNFRRYYHTHSQAGVTLLLAILILATVMAISFSLATIMFIEIKSSSDLTKTEPTFYASEALSEDSLFYARRHITATNFPFTTRLNNVTATTTNNSLTDPVFQDQVPASSVDMLNSKNRYWIFNPAATNPYTAGSGYGLLRVTYLNTNTSGYLHVYICEFDPLDVNFQCNSQSSSYIIYSAMLGPGQSTSDSSVVLNPNKQQELVIYGDAPPVENRWVLIQGFASDRTTAQGIPYFGQSVMDVKANGADTARRVRVTIPGSD